MQGLDIKAPNPGFNWTWLIDFLIRILKPILDALSPIIREALEEFLLELYQKALETDNPWDDYVIRFFLRILGIPVPA